MRLASNSIPDIQYPERIYQNRSLPFEVGDFLILRRFITYFNEQFLRFLFLVPCLPLPCQRPSMNQGRTKDEPKNSQLQKVLFIKNPISFTSLIGCSIPPSDDRETTEGTPKEGHMTKKALFLRLSPKKVDLIPEKVVFIPKKVDCFPETVDLHFSPLRPNSTPYTRKIAQKYDFSHFSSIKCVFHALLAIIAHSTVKFNRQRAVLPH